MCRAQNLFFGICLGNSLTFPWRGRDGRVMAESTTPMSVARDCESIAHGVIGRADACYARCSGGQGAGMSARIVAGVQSGVKRLQADIARTLRDRTRVDIVEGSAPRDAAFSFPTGMPDAFR